MDLSYDIKFRGTPIEILPEFTARVSNYCVTSGVSSMAIIKGLGQCDVSSVTECDDTADYFLPKRRRILDYLHKLTEQVLVIENDRF